MRGSSAASRTAVNRGPPAAGVRAPVHHPYRNPGLNLSQDEIPIRSCTNNAALRMSESIRTSPPHPVGIAARYGQVAGVAGSKTSTRRGRPLIPPLRWRADPHPPPPYSPPPFPLWSPPPRPPPPPPAGRQTGVRRAAPRGNTPPSY